MHSFPLLTIAKTLRKGHTSSEFFFKKTSVLYRGYFQNHHQLCPSFLTFSKNFISSLLLSQKHPEMVTPFLNFFQKKRYTLPGLYPKRHPIVLLLSEKIPKNIITTPLIISFSPQKRCTMFKKNWKFLFPYLAYHRLGVVVVPFSPKKQAAKKRVALPLYRGYFQNLPQLRCCFPKKSEKNITSTPLTIKIPPLFCNTLFQLFFKNFCLSTADYHFFSAFCFCILEKKLKNLTDWE